MIYQHAASDRDKVIAKALGTFYREAKNATDADQRNAKQRANKDSERTHNQQETKGADDGNRTQGASPLIGVAVLVVGGRVLVGAECVQAARGRVAGHRREFLPGDEPAPPPDGDQLADLMAVAGDGERLPVLDGVHDLP